VGVFLLERVAGREKSLSRDRPERHFEDFLVKYIPLLFETLIEHQTYAVLGIELHVFVSEHLHVLIVECGVKFARCLDLVDLRSHFGLHDPIVENSHGERVSALALLQPLHVDG